MDTCETWTPRPVIETEGLHECEWDEYPWERVLSQATKVIVSFWRAKQKKLFEMYDVGEDTDDLRDPNPFEPYYVFYIKPPVGEPGCQPTKMDSPR